MRLLILLLALLSAFFVSNSFAGLPDMDDLKPPKIDTKPCEAASFHGGGSDQFKVCSFDNAKMQSCSMLAGTISASSSTEYSWNAGGTCVQEGGSIKIIQEGVRIYSNGQRLPTTNTYSVWFANLQGVQSPSCPPPTDPEHTIPVNSGLSPTGTMCAKEYDPYNDCPESSENDPFVFGVGGQTTQCFKNPDGSQCKISTDENGGYYVPVSYGSAEPEHCREKPYEPVEKTEPTAPKPEPEKTDPTPEIEPIDAMNKVNENLDFLNTNQLESSKSNDALLERIVNEIQIGNQVSGQIRDQPSTYTGLPYEPTTGTGTGTGEPCTGDDCEPCTGDDCGEEPADDFSITGARKTGGLNAIFTVEDTALVTAEIEAKKTELTDYIELIKNESSTILDVDPNISGSYTDHKETIKGVEVDLGIGRFSSFYQMIAPAIILIASITALFIILGGNKE